MLGAFPLRDAHLPRAKMHVTVVFLGIGPKSPPPKLKQPKFEPGQIRSNTQLLTIQ
jgi:hypothetical protein